LCYCIYLFAFFFSDSLEQSSFVINALVGEQVFLPCQTPSVDSETPSVEVEWLFQQICFSSKHEISCSNHTVVQLGDQFRVRLMTSDDKSLVIKSVSEKMNGIYTCEARRGLRLYSRVQLNVFCE